MPDFSRRFTRSRRTPQATFPNLVFTSHDVFISSFPSTSRIGFSVQALVVFTVLNNSYLFSCLSESLRLQAFYTLICDRFSIHQAVEDTMERSAKYYKQMERSAEYYKQMEVELNVLKLTQRVYKDSSEDLQSWIKNLWYQ